MNKAGEVEENECFHDSLDRLYPSSDSSFCSPYSSSSESEVNDLDDCPNDSVPVLAPEFPTGIFDNYDVWVSEPSSVQERRLRLLQNLGLTDDPSLVRHQSPDRRTDSSLGKSESSERLDNECLGETVSIDSRINFNNKKSFSGGLNRISLSEYDATVGSRIDNECLGETVSIDSRINFNNKKSFSGGLNRISLSEYDATVGSRIGRSKSESECKSTIGLSNNAGLSGGGIVSNISNLNQFHAFVDGSFPNSLQTGNGNGSSPSSKPPKGKARISNKGKEGSGLGHRKVEVALEGNGLGINPGAPVCTIKNLDNGKEFVVNEFREDGMWNKLKEVGTGQQLTMEEFEMTVGTSPIVQELMRRQNVEEVNGDANTERRVGSGGKVKKKSNWFKSLRNVASSVMVSKEGRSSDDRDTSSEKGGRRSSSATDESQEAFFAGPEKIRVKQSGKPCKELTAMYRMQEINAHKGSIWTIKFSLDGKYLASAGEDCIVHVWQVVESERKGDLVTDNLNNMFVAKGSPKTAFVSPNVDGLAERRRRRKSSLSRKSVNLENIRFPETMFSLSEIPFRSFQGHLADVLDLSWSQSQYLLSSSMDKTVRLWNLSSESCLKIFSHSDYVTCIRFNPVDERYFISGSLDAKVRIWSIPGCKVVDWNDLHEMVTAVCYTPDGQDALVGTYKGSCHLYDTTDNKLQMQSEINLQSKKKKSQKKITGFQFAPRSTREVLITSADSRIRVIDGTEVVHKYKGFRNTNSQISASLTADGNYVVCASEDSHVYVWRHEGDSRPSRTKGVTVTQAYETFICQDVTVAVPWPSVSETRISNNTVSQEHNGALNQLDEVAPLSTMEDGNGDDEMSSSASRSNSSPIHGTISSSANFFFDRSAATWPEEKLSLAVKIRNPLGVVGFSNQASSAAWGMVIVTAGLKGDIKIFQNFGLTN